MNENIFTTRIFGSATFDACQVAEGILDARILNNTKLCDIAAGKIIVEESGGKVSNFEGEHLDYLNIKDVIISSNNFHDKLVRILE